MRFCGALYAFLSLPQHAVFGPYKSLLPSDTSCTASAFWHLVCVRPVILVPLTRGLLISKRGVVPSPPDLPNKSLVLLSLPLRTRSGLIVRLMSLSFKRLSLGFRLTPSLRMLPELCFCLARCLQICVRYAALRPESLFFPVARIRI